MLFSETDPYSRRLNTLHDTPWHLQQCNFSEETLRDANHGQSLRDIHRNADLITQRQTLLIQIQELSEQNYNLKKKIKYLDSRVGLLIAFQKDQFEKRLKKKNKRARSRSLTGQQTEGPPLDDYAKQVLF